MAENNQKQVLITFDYELFLGRKSGSVSDCLLNPTNRLLKILDRNNLKGLFFVDTVYLLRMKQMAELHSIVRSDLLKIEQQLCDMLRRGHFIFPHIHPHWVDARYDEANNEWQLESLEKYRFHLVPVDLRTALFDQSMILLKEINANSGVDTPIDAYRAGGWSIQPFSDFRECFLRHGIRYDMSVFPGKYMHSTAHWFDFRKVTTPDRYNFSTDIVTAEKNGSFIEYPISSVQFNKAGRWLYFKNRALLKKMGYSTSGKGATVNAVVTEEEDVLKNGSAYRIMASFEGLNAITLFKYLRQIRRQQYFHFISHPKMLTRHELFLTGILCFFLGKIHRVNTNYRTDS